MRVRKVAYLYLASHMGNISLPIHELRLFETEYTCAGLFDYPIPTSVDGSIPQGHTC